MTRSPAIIAFLFVAISTACAGCAPDHPTSTSGDTSKAARPQVTVTSFPLFAIASELAGQGFDIHFPAADQDDPQQWKPSVSDVQAMQAADLILLNGAGYEPWLSTVTLPQSRLCNTAEGYVDRLLTEQSNVAHQHGPNGVVSNQKLVGATWLHPQLFNEQMHKVAQQLQRLKPDAAAAIEKRAEKIRSRLEELEDRLKQLAVLHNSRNASTRFVIVADGPPCMYLLSDLCPVSERVHSTAISGEGLRALLSKPRPGDTRTLLACRLENLSTFQPVSEEFEVPVFAYDLCQSATEGSGLLERLEANIHRLESTVNWR